SWSSAQLDEVFKDERASVWGACEGESLLGYALLYRLPFEAEVQAISVTSRARRRGIARALLERLCDEARGWRSERVLLEVRESNQAARALYAWAGFAIDGRRRGYYRSADGLGEDALLMSKTLEITKG
ncbi:MAG TPA: ribosomal protein S18-alanine N-acetyltransferase, partial [Modicisalibacter sp.]|nr:ribosomal protein S18-alanine N-acetyltransferase [Modicisalibacter sp.]